jgi:hypothetical protein
MFAKYGGVIANEIRRKNVVAGNFQDHYQDNCEKLIAARVLERFAERVYGSTDDPPPDEMTSEDVCKLLGIKIGAWRSRQWSFHKVFLGDLKGMVPVGSEGKTHGTITRNGKCVSWCVWMPSPIEGSGGYASDKARFKTSDVIEIPHRGEGYFRHMNFDHTAWPPRSVQPHHFQAYLVRAVRNHFMNACRTIMRRHKDRTADHFAQLRSPDGAYNPNWEDAQPDTRAASEKSITAGIELRERLNKLVTQSERDEITDLLRQMKNQSIVEAVRASSLATEKKQILLRMCEA